MCEESEVSELSPGVTEGASHRRGYVSSSSNFSDAGEQSGKVTKCWQRCQISRLFHEDGQDVQVINLSIFVG